MTFAARAAAVRDNPDAVRDAWEAGQLWWLLSEDQYPAYVWIRRHLHGGDLFAPFWRYILEWARRNGKTFVYAIIALEELRRHRGIRINFASATARALKEIVWPLIHGILATCPEDLRPRTREGIGRLEVHHGKPEELSYMVLAGCDSADDREKLRGMVAWLNIVSEAGIVGELKYLFVSVLNAQLKTTLGATLIEGTPPRSSGHEYADIIATAEALDARDGTPDARISRRTWRDNRRDTPEMFELYLRSDAELLGLTVEEYKLTSDFRREWECETVTDETTAVIPEATPERMRDRVVGVPGDVPLHRDRYVSMDLGFNPDWTGILLGYWDYPRQQLVIEWEQVLRRASDTDIAECLGGRWRREATDAAWSLAHRKRIAFSGLEAEKYGEFGMEHRAWGPHQPFLRVSDNNWPASIAELAAVHGLPFTATAKTEREVYIWHARRWFLQDRIRIHPRCVQLVTQCKAAIWNKGRTDFAHTSAHGHFDLLASLIIMIRNVIPYQNKLPAGWGDTEDTWRTARPADGDPDLAALKGAFG